MVESRRWPPASFLRSKSCCSLALKTLASSETPETVSSSVCRWVWVVAARAYVCEPKEEPPRTHASTDTHLRQDEGRPVAVVIATRTTAAGQRREGACLRVVVLLREHVDAAFVHEDVLGAGCTDHLRYDFFNVCIEKDWFTRRSAQHTP